MTETTSAAQYRALMASRPIKTEKVKCPTGFVFEMKKPNTLGILLGGELPQVTASEVVASWNEQGVAPAPDEASAETQIKIAQKAFEIRDKTLELSHNPKIVIGKAQNDNELSTDEIADEDLTHLFKWTAAGGDTAAMLAMFPEGREQRVMAGIDGKKLRRARKQARGAA